MAVPLSRYAQKGADGCSTHYMGCLAAFQLASERDRRLSTWCYRRWEYRLVSDPKQPFAPLDGNVGPCSTAESFAGYPRDRPHFADAEATWPPSKAYSKAALTACSIVIARPCC